MWSRKYEKMTKSIKNYLNEIEDKLKESLVPSDYIEEFIDNLADQLTTMVDEAREKEPTLNLEDVEASVLTQCEPVKKVIERVITELKTEESWTTADRVSGAKFLRPVETLINKLDRGLIYCEKHIRRLSKWYLKHENPVVTSVTVFLAIIAVTAIRMSFIEPYRWILVQESSELYTYYFLKIVIKIIIVGAVGYIGWRHSYRYALLSGVLLSLLIGSLWIVMLQELRLYPVSGHIIPEDRWPRLTIDWVRAAGPTLGNFSSYMLNFIFLNWFYNITFIILIISVGFLLKTIIRKKKLINSRPPPLNNLLKIGLLVGCLVMVCSIPITYDPLIHSPGWLLIYQDPRLGVPQEPLIYNPWLPLYTNVPMPTSNDPLIYHFEIDWAGGTLSEDYFTQIREFGDLGFYFREFYNFSFTKVNIEEPTLTSKGSFRLISRFNDPFEPSVPSQHPFAILGLLYLPNQFNELTSQEIIASHLNNSYPFRGFTPSLDNTRQDIEWYVNGTYYNLTVNTIRYSSITNGSEYLFSFDRGTGWLMKAELTKDKDSWVAGLRKLKTLTITRYFVYKCFDNPQDYYNIDYLVTLLFISGTGIIFLSCEVFYIMNQKRNSHL